MSHPPCSAEIASERVALADHDDIGRKVINQSWAIQSAIVTIAAHCTVIKDKCTEGNLADISDMAGCISQDLLELANFLSRAPAQAPSGDIFEIAVHALTVGAPGLSPAIREGIARSILMRTSAQGVAVTSHREALAETIHNARWPADRQMAITPFSDEDKNGREYCLRIADAVIAAQPQAVSEETPTKEEFAKWSRAWHNTCDTILTLLGLPGNGSPQEMLAQVQDYVGRTQPQTPWQPIETAPKDGPIILGWPKGFHPLVGHYEDGLWGELTTNMGFFVYPTQPTHWMSLPAPPLSRPEFE